jgi:hypothetical protein
LAWESRYRRTVASPGHPPFYDLFKKQASDLKLPFTSLREKKRGAAETAQVLRELDRPLKKGEKLWPPGLPVE